MRHSAPPAAYEAPPLALLAGAGTSARPRSASSAWTGAAGVGAALVAIVLLRDWTAAPWLKTLATLGAAAAAMILVDVAIYQTHLNPTTGLTRATLRPVDPLRLAQKLVGFWLTIAALAAAYCLLPPLAGDSFASFRSAALWCPPALSVFSPF